ncbi:MAG: alpha/beta hydrolase family protein [Cyclobacteriaceae bacterium]
MRRVLLFGFLTLIGSDLLSQDQILINDNRIPATDTVWVFTPESYSENVALPIVYLLHGYSGNYRQWHDMIDAQQYANNYNMVVVCPDGFYNSWYINSPLKTESQYADFFFETLIPKVESSYKINQGNRFITGLSMGGHGAFHLFTENPEMFRSAGSTSGVMDIRGSKGLFELAEHFGKYEENNDRWLAFSAVGNIDSFKKAGKEIIFDCGTEDPFYRWNKDFYELCLQEKVPVTFISQPGKHDSDYWKKSIRSYFEFFKTNMDR